MSVKQYFDSIAHVYSKRYGSHSSYHQYFFNERLKAATCGSDFDGKTILDIGAGTGPLYNWLNEHSTGFDYLATDVSKKMLANSKIPIEHRLFGDLSDISPFRTDFDFIFMLGVSSYMQKKQLKENFKIIEKHLGPKGIAIISFTHSGSLDYYSRTLIRCLIKFFALTSSKSRTLLRQIFPTYAYSLLDIENMSSGIFHIKKIKWCNQTITPFNQWLPKLSIFFAQQIKKSPENSLLLRKLSADYLVFFHKENK